MGTPKNQAARRRPWSKEPFILAVEGYGDLTFYAEMMEHLDFVAADYFIQDLGGCTKQQIRARLSTFLRPDTLQEISSFAFLLDADDEPGAAFERARRALREAIGVDVPTAGDWCRPTELKTRFGIFIVGGPGGPGEVESLAWAAWSKDPANQKLGECVENFVDCAAKTGTPLQSIDKVRMGALLSVLNEEDPRLGPGARANVFNLEAPEFGALRTFLRGMAG